MELAKISFFHFYVSIPSDVEGIKQLKGEVPPSPFNGHEHQVNSVAYSPDGRQFASSSDDSTAGSGTSRLAREERSVQILVVFDVFRSLQTALE